MADQRQKVFCAACVYVVSCIIVYYSRVHTEAFCRGVRVTS